MSCKNARMLRILPIYCAGSPEASSASRNRLKPLCLTLTILIAIEYQQQKFCKVWLYNFEKRQEAMPFARYPDHAVGDVPSRRHTATSPYPMRWYQALQRTDPPPLNWSILLLNKRRTRDGQQTSQTRRNCHEAALGRCAGWAGNGAVGAAQIMQSTPLLSQIFQYRTGF